MATRFEKLVKLMPAVLTVSFDPLRHTTVDDLIFLATYELDLDDEGELETELTIRERCDIRRFRMNCKAMVGLDALCA